MTLEALDDKLTTNEWRQLVATLLWKLRLFFPQDAITLSPLDVAELLTATQHKPNVHVLRNDASGLTLILLGKDKRPAKLSPTERIQRLAETRRRAASQPRVDVGSLGEDPPVDMVLWCPACARQHVDAPNPAKNWDNPPHKTHECQFCGYLWRVCDRPTNGVEMLESAGLSDMPARPHTHLETYQVRHPERPWIPVKEMLPEPAQKVLVCWEDEFVYVATYHEGLWHNTAGRPTPSQDIIAWMPLPDTKTARGHPAPASVPVPAEPYQET